MADVGRVGQNGSGRIATDRNFRSSTKTNSNFKWKLDRTVIGAFEIATEPDLDVRAAMTLHKINGCKDELKKCLEIWDRLNLRLEFIKTFESIPPESTCCGLFVKEDETIRNIIPLMNDGWAKTTNEKFLMDKGFRVSLFVWQWANISGKAETVIPMIRFHRYNDDEKEKPRSKSDNR